MKVAVLSESSADEAAIRILLAAILGRPTQEISLEPIRTRGWPAVLHILPIAIRRLHYHTDAEALVVVVDSDESPIHARIHDHASGGHPECRLCNIRQIVLREKSTLREVPGREELRTATGLAVPCIEAWYRCGVDNHVNEATWNRRLQSGESIVYSKTSLKRDVYGTDRPSLELETSCAIRAANRLGQNIADLERLFPEGFGPFLAEARQW